MPDERFHTSASPKRIGVSPDTTGPVETESISEEPSVPKNKESLGPIPQERRSRLLDEDIGAKSGNYIFTFGFPGSGKTTFHSFLIRYLMEEGPFKTEFVTKDSRGGVNYDINRMVTTWKSEWREGHFPKPTPVGEEQIRELSFEVRPFQGVRTPLEFTFLEVSGEMLQTVLPTETQDPTLSRILRELLANENLNLILLLLLNPDVHNNDELFVNFMSYMDANLGFDIRQKASLGIIVSKPDDALKTLKKLRRGYDNVAELRAEYIEDFVEHFAKSTYRIWFDWPSAKKKMLARFYLGEIKSVEGEQSLYRPDYHSVSRIFEWIYLQFTGVKLGPTLLQRIIRFLKT